MSSRKFHTGTCLGDEATAKEMRLCFCGVEDDEVAGKGALNENVEEDGSLNLGLVIESFVGDDSPVCKDMGEGICRVFVTY